MIRAYWGQQKNPLDRTLIGWVPRPFIYSRIGREQIVEAAQRNSQLPKVYLQQTFDALIVEVENFVMNGHSITLNGLGTIRTFFRGIGSTTAEAYDIQEGLKQVKFSFRPDPVLRRMLLKTPIHVTDVQRPYIKPDQNNG